MEQFQVLQNHSEFYGLDQENLSGAFSNNLVDVASMNDRSVSVLNYHEQIDNEMFFFDCFPCKHSNDTLLDSEGLELCGEKTRKISTGSFDDAFVLTDFKRYIHKLSYEQIFLPQEKKSFSVPKRKIMKWTGNKKSKIFRKDLLLRNNR